MWEGKEGYLMCGGERKDILCVGMNRKVSELRGENEKEIEIL